MEITCPACRKVNAVFGSVATSCARCGCELGSLAALARAAGSHLRLAAASLRAGQADAALDHAVRSWTLRHSPFAAALAALAAASSGDLRELRHWRARWREQQL